MLRLLSVLVAGLMLTGCATGCREACVFGFGPGNAIFDKVADSHDSQDPCNTAEFSRLTGERLKPAGYTYKDIPWWCGGGKRTGTVYVKGYHRSNGTYVRSHTRTAPDGNPYNNLK